MTNNGVGSRRGRACLNNVMHKKEMNWNTVVRHYRIKHLPKHRAEIRWFFNQPTLAAAIERAAIAEDCRGKRYDHQRRIPKDALTASFHKLKARETRIRACKSFDQLHELILETLEDVRGIGELYCYDTAVRIGAKCNLRPKTILLHAGTRTGASLIADVRGRSSLTKKDLPRELRRLPPEQVEDILCIYKDRIGGLGEAGAHPKPQL